MFRSEMDKNSPTAAARLDQIIDDLVVKLAAVDRRRDHLAKAIASLRAARDLVAVEGETDTVKVQDSPPLDEGSPAASSANPLPPPNARPKAAIFYVLVAEQDWMTASEIIDSIRRLWPGIGAKGIHRDLNRFTACDPPVIERRGHVRGYEYRLLQRADISDPTEGDIPPK